MDDIEKAAADQKAMEEAAVAAEAEKAAAGQAAEEAIAAKDAEIVRLTKEKDNYKTVALKRLGKLDGDADFMGVDKDSGLTVQEQVRAELLQREIDKIQAVKDLETRRLARENAELKLALKNRPNGSIGSGSGSGSSTEVKDNTFSEAQLTDLRQRALRLQADPEQFIENAKKNLIRNS